MSLVSFLFQCLTRAWVCLNWTLRSEQHTIATQEVGILREFLVELLQRIFHGYQGPVRDRACVDGLRGFFPEQVCTNDAVDAIGADDDVRGRRGVVLEMDLHGTVVLLVVYDLVDAFVEVGAFGGDAFYELVEEVGAVDALLAGGVLLGVDELAFVVAFALLRVSNIRDSNGRL